MDIKRASPKDAIEFVRKHNPDALSADGLNYAIIGSTLTPPVLVYSMAQIIAGLIREGLNRDEALDHYYFNIAGAFVGRETPIFLSDF